MLDRVNLIDTRRIFHPNAVGFTFFSSAHGTILLDRSHARCLIKFEMKITTSIFYDHNTMRLEINYKKKKTDKKNQINHKHIEAKQYVTKQTMDH